MKTKHELLQEHCFLELIKETISVTENIWSDVAKVEPIPVPKTIVPGKKLILFSPVKADRFLNGSHPVISVEDNIIELSFKFSGSSLVKKNLRTYKHLTKKFEMIGPDKIRGLGFGSVFWINGIID